MSFQKFLQERKYISNVTTRTIEWHEQSLKWLGIEQPTAEDLKACVIRMRKAGLKASSVNCRLRSIQAYLRWANVQDGSGCEAGVSRPLLCPRVKEEQTLLPSFSADDIKKFCQWKPRTIFDHRLQVLILLLADTGVRVSEALNLKWSQVDFDNLLITVMGKGRKVRTIPFSFAMRKYLWKWRNGCVRANHAAPASFVFSTRDGSAVSRHTVNRDVHLLCKELSIVAPPRIVHALRHSYALGALRGGASTMHVMRVLGHSNVSQTQKYCTLLTEDLSECAHRIGSLVA